MRRGEIPQPSATPPKGFSRKAQSRKVTEGYLLLTDFLGRKLDGPVAVGLAERLCRAAGLFSGEACLAVEFSLQHLHGMQLEEGNLHGLLAWVSENRDYPAAGEGIPLWSGTPPIWAYLQVVDGQVEKIRDIPMLKMVLRSHSGVIAGNYVELRVSPKYARWLVKEIGYPKYGRAHELEIVGSVMWGLLGSGERGKTKLLRVEASSSMLEANRELFRARKRKKCSQPYPCHACPLTRRRCGLACRA